MATIGSMMAPMASEVLRLRHASRELVRELGFLRGRDESTSLSHSHCHALIEIDARGELAQSELPTLLRLDKSTTSRIVAELEARGLARARVSDDDGRARILSLSPRGRAKLEEVHRGANARVEDALALLSAEEREVVVRGMQLYARGLERARRRAAYAIRPVRPGDRAGIARLIRTVMPEFGAKGPGFAILDPEVDDMPGAYCDERSGYFVVTRAARTRQAVRGGAGARARDRDEVVGGGGFAPLVGGDPETCELRKMYFLPEVRGLGLGQAVLDRCLEGARAAGFRSMYLETLASMAQARVLYERNGFERLTEPQGDTGHYGCNAFYAKVLSA
jgi:putative acetyltransferase